MNNFNSPKYANNQPAPVQPTVNRSGRAIKREVKSIIKPGLTANYSNTNELPEFTNTNQQFINSVTETISNYKIKLNELKENEHDANAAITEIFEDIKYYDINNVNYEKNSLGYIEKYLKDSFNKLSEIISNFNGKFSILTDGYENINKYKDELETFNNEINNFITNPSYEEGKISSNNPNNYKVVIKLKMKKNLADLKNLSASFDTLSKIYVNTIKSGEIAFIGGISKLKKELKINIIYYFNEKIVKQSYNKYETLGQQFSENIRDTEKLNILYEMQQLLNNIKDDIEKLQPILNKGFPYNNNNNYKILNDNQVSINQEKVEINLKINNTSMELDNLIVNYKLVTSQHIKDIQLQINAIIASIKPIMANYNNKTAGPDFAIDLNTSGFEKYTSDQFSSKLTEILQKIDTKLGRRGSQNVAEATDPSNSNLAQNLRVNNEVVGNPVNIVTVRNPSNVAVVNQVNNLGVRNTGLVNTRLPENLANGTRIKWEKVINGKKTGNIVEGVFKGFSTDKKGARVIMVLKNGESDVKLLSNTANHHITLA